MMKGGYRLRGLPCYLKSVLKNVEGQGFPLYIELTILLNSVDVLRGCICVRRKKDDIVHHTF